MTALATPWQAELRGLLLGRGTRFPMTEAPQGLGSPGARIADIAPMAADGVYAAGDYAEARTVTWSMACLGVDAGDAEDRARELAGAWQPSRTDLGLTMRLANGRSYYLLGRPRKCELNLSTLKYGHALAAVMFVATDPRLYSAEATAVTIPLGSGVPSGMTFDATFDLRFQAVGATPPGVTTITNEGTTVSRPIITIAGVVTDPRLENLTTGETLELDLVLGAMDVVTIDMATRSIRLNGANVLGSLVAGSTFWGLAPGANLVAFRAPVDTTAAAATITFRSAWF